MGRPPLPAGTVMLNVTVVMAGRTKEPYIREGVAFFRQRLRPYLHLDLLEVRAEKEVKGLTPELAKAREGERLLARVSPRAFLIALDPQGEEFTTEQFAAWLSRREEAAQPLAFLIGGHLGLAGAVLRQAHQILALSRLTLTHELARLVLLEQLYRAMTIKSGHPYHV